MSPRHKLYLKIILAFFGILVIFASVFLSFKIIRQHGIPRAKPETFKKIDYEELSPDGLNKIILYSTIFNPNIYRSYYEEYFDNNMIVSARDEKDGKENYIFTGGRLGEPKWLGNEHVFFTAYCGSGCQGIYLINVLDKETRLGVLTVMDFEKNKPVYTDFKDWFGRDFSFNGLVDEISSKIIGNKAYFIFKMVNEKGAAIGAKEFLFTGKALEDKKIIN